MADWRDDVQRMWVFADKSPAFDFDTVISEGHRSTLAIMDNPVETGVVVSDHVFMLPRELEIYGVVSDVWLGMRTADRDKVGPLKPDKKWLVSTDAGDSSGRCQRAFQLLLGLQASGTPFQVQTGLRIYQNMLITELSANQDKTTASALKFRAALREVQIVSTENVTYPPRGDAKTTNAAAKPTNGGLKQAVPPPPEKKASLLLRGARAVGLVN